MCRHLAYLGTPWSPEEAVFRAPHALLRQASHPRDMRAGGTVNADGFGLGWFERTTDPVRYRRARPLWADEVLPQLAGTVRPEAFVAAVRSATPGLPVTDVACAPFADDGWLFSHNGVVRGWPESVIDLAGQLPVAELLRLEAPTDSALLWAVLRQKLRDGTDPVVAVGTLIREVERVAPGSRLNVILASPDLLVATAWTHSLSFRATSTGVLVASEPVDQDSRWRPVPDGHLITAHRNAPETAALFPIAERSTG